MPAEGIYDSTAPATVPTAADATSSSATIAAPEVRLDVARTGFLDTYSDDADGVRSWLTDNNLTGIAEVLVNAGVDTMTDLLGITEGDKDDLAEDGLKKMKFKRLVQAVNAANAAKGEGGGGGDDGGGGESKDDLNGAAGVAGGEEAGECVVCMDGENTHLFSPCGHKCVCEECAKAIMQTSAECPTCRGEARGFIRVYS